MPIRNKTLGLAICLQAQAWLVFSNSADAAPGNSSDPSGQYFSCYKDTLRVSRLKNDSFRFEFSATKPLPGESYNFGTAVGIGKIIDSAAVVSVKDRPNCQFLAYFKDKKVMIIQQGNDFDCGFGHGVDATGIYSRKRQKPTPYPEPSKAKAKFVDEQAKALPGEFDTVEPFSDGLAAVRQLNKWGFIDRKGHWAIPCKFSNAGSFSNGLAPAWIKGKCGFINKQGAFVLKPIYDAGFDFSKDGIAIVRSKNGGKYHYINTKGEKISDFYDDCQPFSDGMGIVSRGGLYGAIDTSGRECVPIKFKQLRPFHDGLQVFSQSHSLDSKAGYLDKSGKIAIAAKFEEADDFSEGLAAVRVGNRFGYIDTQGKFAIPPQFMLTAGQFTNGRAVVRRASDAYFTIIDKSGNTVGKLPYGFCSASNFEDGTAVARFLNWNGLDSYLPVDATGKVLASFLREGAPKVSSYWPKSEGLFVTADAELP